MNSSSSSFLNRTRVKPVGRLQAIPWLLVGLGVAGMLASVGFAFDTQHFFRAYLVAYVSVLTPVLGMLFFVMLHHLVDAGWSTVIRRPAEQVTAAMPVLTVLFLPVLLGLSFIYKWTNAEYVANDALFQIKQPFLNVPFFLLRAVFYFAVWNGLVWTFRGLSLKQDKTGEAQLSLRMRARSGPGLIAFAITFSFAAIDWLMTLDFHWFSTIFGIYIFAGAASAGLALLTLICLNLRQGILADQLPLDRIHDLAKWVFTFSVFWAYVSFSQWFLIWYANIPEETGWMLARWDGQWRWVTLVMVAFRFVIPFVTLMSAAAKRNLPLLGGVCCIILLGHYIEMQWLVMPVYWKNLPDWSRIWIDAALLLLIAVACGLTIRQGGRSASPVPKHDPRLAEALA